MPCAVLADHRSSFGCLSGERRHNLPTLRSGLRLRRAHRERTWRDAHLEEPHKSPGGSMMNPRQHGEPFLHDPPPVFGKPWYWQRSSSTMESSRSLAQVIMEMRDEIKKLEAENRELRADSGGQQSGTAGESSAGSEQPATLENPYGYLRRNASAPVLEGQYKENAAMTVRRYSTSSSLSGLTVREGRIDKNRQSGSGWDRLHEEIQHDSDASGEAEKADSRHSLQEYVHKNRAKVKTVTFLLPVDDIYTSRPVLTKHQEEPKITGLASIAETES